MSDMHEDLEKLENRLIKAKLELQNIKGLAKIFSEYEHPSKYPRKLSANDQTARALITELNFALMHLKQFEIYKDFYFNQESCYEKILDIMEGKSYADIF